MPVKEQTVISRTRVSMEDEDRHGSRHARSPAWKPSRISPERSAAVPRVSGSVIRRDSKLESAGIHGRRTVDVRYFSPSLSFSLSLGGNGERTWVESCAGCVPYFYKRRPARFLRAAAYPPRHDTLSFFQRVVPERQRGTGLERSDGGSLKPRL